MTARVDDALLAQFRTLATPTLANALDDVACERAFLATLEGSCRTPIAGHATINGDRISFRGETLSLDGKHVFTASREGSRKDAARLGADAAAEVKAKGGSLIATQ